METRKINSIVFGLIVVLLVSCGNKTAKTQSVHSIEHKVQEIELPKFNADSAYQYVATQVGFGPRVPNTDAHKACGNYLVSQLERFGAVVYTQEKVFQGFEHEWEGKNIIGEFFPEKPNRILLCAHWDSRYTADREPTEEGQKHPVDGANDGASGVGVLLELARIFQTDTPAVGVDIVFFDVEDQGVPSYKHASGQSDYWCLGSQYWSATPHKDGYNAEFGILLDMVGAPGAVFRREIYSMQFAKNIVDKVWAEAVDAGYSSQFSFEHGGGILDDHYYVNNVAKIPTIDIIHFDNTSQHGFGTYWHTVNDNMDAIDKQTLKAVGQTVSNVVFKENR